MPKYIPLDMLPKEQYIALLDTFKETAYQRARRLIEAHQLIDRELEPGDLGLATTEWVFTGLSAGANDIIPPGFKLDDKVYILIYEIFDLTGNPNVIKIDFGTPAKIVDTVYLEELHQYDRVAAILTRPIEVNPGQTPVIKLYLKQAGDVKFGFRGIVIEPMGRTIGG